MTFPSSGSLGSGRTRQSPSLRSRTADAAAKSAGLDVAPLSRVQQALLSPGTCSFLHNAFARIHVPGALRIRNLILNTPVNASDHGRDRRTVGSSPRLRGSSVSQC